MCEDGLTELGQLSGYNQTVTYDKLGNVRRIVEKIGAKDRVSLGTKVWQTSYSSACAVGLGDDQGDLHDGLYPINTLAGQSGLTNLGGSVKGRAHSTSVPPPSEPAAAASPAASAAKRQGGGRNADAKIKLLAETLRSAGRVPQVEAKGPKQARPPSYKPVYIHASTLTTGKQPRTLSVAGDSERRGGVVGGGVTGSGRVGTAGSFAQTQMRAKRLRTARGGDIPWTPPHGW
eukprot:Tamp_10590.p3 GENE.Tamp_10590~~Tamp_10590.p3  ORF type:complete len:232 (-),score=31.35 Tamp_10590:826-1521(-)